MDAIESRRVFTGQVRMNHRDPKTSGASRAPQPCQQFSTVGFKMDTSVFWASNIFIRPGCLLLQPPPPPKQHVAMLNKPCVNVHNCNLLTRIRPYSHMWPLAWQPPILTVRRKPRTHLGRMARARSAESYRSWVLDLGVTKRCTRVPATAESVPEPPK